MKTKDLTQGSIAGRLITYFLPIWAGALMQQLYNAVDAIIVGQFAGTRALAAIGGTSALLVELTIGFFIGASSGGSVVIAHAFGAGDRPRLKYAIRLAVLLAVICGLTLTVLGVWCTPQALRWMRASEDIFGAAEIYLRIYFLGAVFALLYHMGSAVLQAMGDSRRPLLFLMISSLINIVLDLILVAGFRMGTAGAAAGTVISQGICAALTLRTLCRAEEDSRLQLTLSQHFPDTRREMIRLSVPLGLQYTMYTSSNLIIQAQINRFETEQIAGWTAISRLDGVFWLTMTAFGTAITCFVGQNYGAGRLDRMKRCFAVGGALIFGLSAVLIFGMLLLARPIAEIFSPDPAVQEAAIHMIRFLVPTYITYTGTELIGGMIKGAGNSMAPLVITMVSACLIRGAFAILAPARWPGLETVMLSYPISWMVSTLLFVLYYSFGPWMKEIDQYRRESLWQKS